MTLSRNQNDSNVESANQQFQMINSSKNILNLGGPLISNLLNKNNIQFSEIKPKSNLKRSYYFDELSVKKLWTDELPNLENKFDLIILHDLLEQTKEPKLLLENLSNYLSNDGSIIATIKNFSYFENICKIFGGILPQNNSNIYNLHTLNLFLNNENFVLHELRKNEKKLDYDSNSYLNGFYLPSDVLELLKNPESEVISYVFRIKKKILVDLQTRNWTSTFPKNYFSKHSKEKFDYYQHLEQTIIDKDNIILGLENSLSKTNSHLEQVIKEKDKVIHGLENSLSKTNSHLEQVIKEKDAHLEQVIKEKDAHLEQVIKEKDKVIHGLEKSLNETKSYLEPLIKDKEEYIKEFRKSFFGKAFDLFRKNK